MCSQILQSVEDTSINNITTLLNVRLETNKYYEEKEHGSMTKPNKPKSPWDKATQITGMG